MKERVLFGIFPVWMRWRDEEGREINEISGFWAEIANTIDEMLYFACDLFSFGKCQREFFNFLPYKSNGCKYWFQAIYCRISGHVWK